jgi:hypothetical protein
MRISASMLRRLSSGIFVLAFLLLAVIPAGADTGTYQISDYVITLEPQSDGQVRITVEQQWQVLSGDIPWVTVGLPNENFSIENYGGAVSKVSSSNGNGFFGVRVDLDKDYKPGQSFEIRFTVLQGNLLERLTSDKKWRISYTPGWYDRASIDHLQINLVSPVDYQTYTSVSPMPSSVNNNVITWERLNLSPGSQFNITVESTDGSFLSASVPTGSSQGNGLGIWFYVIVAVILIVGFLVFWGIRKNRQFIDARNKESVRSIEEEMAADKKKREEIEKGFEGYVEKKNIEPDAQGRYYDRSYGDYITPAIWAGVIASQFNRQQTPQPGSGFRTGCVSCACVSCACACACACAGGGAAGCSRKSLHECRTCSILKGKMHEIDTSGTP